MFKRFSAEARPQYAAMAGLRNAALAALLLAGICAPMSASAAPAGCAALQAKYPDLKGKTLVNAINPHTPGYEFDRSEGPQQIRRLRHRSRRADRRVPRLHADLQGRDLRGTADDAGERPGRHRHLRYLRHRGARQGRRLHHLFQGVRRRAGRQGQPEEDQRHQYCRCAARRPPRTPAMSKSR